MANFQVIDIIIQTTAEMVVYLLPVIGLLSGLIFVFSVLYEFTIGAVKSIK